MAMLTPSGQPVCSRCWLTVRAPGCKPELRARLFGMSPDTLLPTAASNLHSSGQSDWSPLGELAVEPLAGLDAFAGGSPIWPYLALPEICRNPLDQQYN